jgi:hypothetical protein
VWSFRRRVGGCHAREPLRPGVLALGLGPLGTDCHSIVLARRCVVRCSVATCWTATGAQCQVPTADAETVAAGISPGA